MIVWAGRLQTGDIDMDGLPDVIIGAPGAVAKTQSGVAAVPDASGGRKTYVVYSNDLAGISLKSLATVDLASPPTDRVTEINGGAPGIRSGWAVGSADMDLDGRGEVIIGAPFANSEAGVTYVVYGNPSLPRLPALHLSLQDPLSITVAQILGELPFDHSGWAIAGAGFNGDNSEDVAIGAPLADVTGVGVDVGKTHIVSGSAGLPLHSIFNLAVPPQPIVVVTGNLVGEQSGWSVAGGHILTSDPADLIIGAPFAANYL